MGTDYQSILEVTEQETNYEETKTEGQIESKNYDWC